VPQGTTVAEAFWEIGVDVAEKIAAGFVLRATVPPSDSQAPISLYDVLKPDVGITLLSRMVAGAELGRVEELERRMVDRIQVLTNTASQLRVDINYLSGYARRRTAESLTFSAFWRRFMKQFGANWRRYFLLPTVALFLLLFCLSWLLLSIEKGRNVGVDNFGEAILAVLSYMLTLGYRTDTLDLGGRMIGIASCGLGVIVFGLTVSLLFYSLQD